MGRSPSMGKLLVSTPRPRHHRAKEGNLLTSWHPHPNTGTIMQNLLYQRPRQLTVLTPPLKEKTKHQPSPRRLAHKRLLSSIHHHPAGPPHSHRSAHLTVLHIETNKLIFWFQKLYICVEVFFLLHQAVNLPLIAYLSPKLDNCL